MTTRTTVDIIPGQLTTITLGYSEVCMHMGVSGKDMQIALLFSPEALPMVQLYKDGEPFSFPILPGECGIYRNPDGSFYGYVLADEPS